MGRLRGCCPRTITGCVVFILALIVLLFFVTFVVFPFTFKYSKEIQRNLVFPTWYTKSQNFSDINSFGIEGVRNFYVTVNERENITLGIWQILPHQVLSEFISNDNYNYEGILANETFDVLLYFHGNGGVRSLPLELYAILRQYFHIIAPDYRGYGDSTKAELTEDNVVNDLVELYKWTRTKTNASIFVWGHSLGTGISTHLIANLKNQNVTNNITGLVLETPFSSVTDVIELDSNVKPFTYMPWFYTTILEPMITNGFDFNSKKYILDVDCPIMILHAKDDTVIPYELATRLYDVAVAHRNFTYQGNITYHLFEAKGYDHMLIYSAPELPTYIRNFVDECHRFQSSRN